MKEIVIYTDGACSGNPGPGGWGALLKYGDTVRELSGFEPETTNNKMELLAAIEAMNRLKEPCRIELYSDSQYLVKGMTEWLSGWKKRGWKKASKEPVLNQELWKQLDSLAQTHDIHWHWVKGHADNPGNNRCDELATSEIKKNAGVK